MDTAPQPYAYILSRPDAVNEDLVRRQTNALLVHLIGVLKIETAAMDRERSLLRELGEHEKQKTLVACPEPMDEMLMIGLAVKRRIHILSADTGFDQRDEILNLAILNRVNDSALELVWALIRRRTAINDGGLSIRRMPDNSLHVIADNPPFPNIIKLMTGEPE